MSSMHPSRHDLSSYEFRQQRRALQGPDTAGFVRAMLFDYTCIAAAITAVIFGWANLSGASFVALLVTAWVVIASRQHALLVLMHDATHFLASDDHEFNDWLGELFTAAPMLVSLQTYRKDHLAHHQHTNTGDDPDWVRKLEQPQEAAYWKFPVQQNMLLFLGKVWARSVVYLLRSFRHLSGAGKSKKKITNPAAIKLKRSRQGLYLSIALLLTLTSGWGWFALLWLAPILLVLPMITRLRSIAEHFALPYHNEFNGSRTIKANWLERFLFAPHNVGHHLDHHLVASVSFRALPKLHATLQGEPAYRQHAHLNDGFVLGRRSLLADLRTQTVGSAMQHSIIVSRT
jgi:fatty acid desaturase